MQNHWTNMLVSVAPFLLLLVLWFFLLRRIQAGKRTTREDPFGPPQQMTTTDVAAELRSLRQSVEALRADIKALDERTGR
jgi:HAMP domain-containing protein